MNHTEGRREGRNSFLFLAEMRSAESSCRIKVRNLSATGMKAESDTPPDAGTAVEAELRNIGWVSGTVAWRRGTTFGVRFDEPVDPSLARAPVGAGEHTPRYVRPPLGIEERKEVRRVV